MSGIARRFSAASKHFQYLGDTSGVSASIALPSHQAGDLLVVVAFLRTRATIPPWPDLEQPSGWTPIPAFGYQEVSPLQVGSDKWFIGGAFRVASASGTDSGSWTVRDPYAHPEIPEEQYLLGFAWRGGSGVGNREERIANDGTSLVVPGLTCANTGSYIAVVAGSPFTSFTSGGDPSALSGMTPRLLDTGTRRAWDSAVPRASIPQASLTALSSAFKFSASIEIRA
ncbi:MAG: hypothetical protein EOM22_03915 [Gammaproteobacteria bacterium]|nr:hypothetical protein [Gammaproteobacteria bacterium]